MQKIIKKSIQNAMSYTEYKKLINTLVAINKSTGENQSDILLNFSKLNAKRMKRLDKTILLNKDTLLTIKETKKDLLFLVLTESWCGDAAQTLPIMYKISEISPQIDFKIILRDANDDLMQRYLTNGGKSIPKLLIIDKNTNDVLNSWGPRPSIATKMVMNFKKEHGALDAEFKKDLQIWYNKDKGISTQHDLMEIIENL
ncbi:MAG: thioredoxin family protein [Flavobacteriaceae bacterium]